MKKILIFILAMMVSFYGSWAIASKGCDSLETKVVNKTKQDVYVSRKLNQWWRWEEAVTIHPNETATIGKTAEEDESGLRVVRLRIFTTEKDIRGYSRKATSIVNLKASLVGCNVSSPGVAGNDVRVVLIPEDEDTNLDQVYLNTDKFYGIETRPGICSKFEPALWTVTIYDIPSPTSAE